ncbi:MAG: ABC transporter ATP-binding protein [Acidimicrobiia bacterium]
MGEIELRGIGKRFGRAPAEVVALESVDLTLSQDEIVAVVGPSGCGKTTLLRILAGLSPPTEGRVLVDGADLWAGTRARPAGRHDMAVVFQEANLLPWLSVAANIALPLRLRGARRREQVERAREMCALVGIDGFEDHRPSELSIGMQHRAAIARSIVESPRVLLLDEPFAALDAISREGLNMELERLWLRQPCTYLLITHSISEAVFLADRVVSMTARPGRIAGITEVPFGRPRSLALTYTHQFQQLAAQVRTLLEAAA